MKKIFLLFGLILTVIVSSANFTMAQHRKMSSQAKGALIGGAGGAIAGGLIGHGVKGALIGGAIGAGGGYVIGNEHRRNKAKRNAYYRSSHRSSRYYSRRRYN
jgi:uncharacterized protein YcfJ